MITREDMNRALNVLNNSSITHTKAQMRNRNQMMSRVQRQEDKIFNNKLHSEKLKILNNISKLDSYECDLNTFNQTKNLLAQRNEVNNFLDNNEIQKEPIQPVQPIEPNYPLLDSFNIPNRTQTRFLRGKR